jgi:hypothetical protein
MIDVARKSDDRISLMTTMLALQEAPAFFLFKIGFGWGESTDDVIFLFKLLMG